MNQNDKIKRLIKRYKEVLEGGVEDRDPTVCYIYAIKDLESLLESECEHKNTYNDTRGLDTYEVIRCADCDELL